MEEEEYLEPKKKERKNKKKKENVNTNAKEKKGSKNVREGKVRNKAVEKANKNF